MPLLAKSLKQILHISNLRIYPRGRPQMRHLLTRRVMNFGFRCALMIIDFFAMNTPYFRNGIPSFARRLRASSSVSAVVMIAILSPLIRSILS